MSRSLYGLQSNGGWKIGIRPYAPKYWSDYMTMKKPVNLKKDFGWCEVQDLQNLLRKVGIWPDLPASGYTLVNAEFKGGDEDQRIDLLYMRTDGALLPCEIKIGGSCKDSHGQLIRYISDLHFQNIDLAWATRKNANFLAQIKDPITKRVQAKKFKAFVAGNKIQDPFVRILPRAGVLMDEEFTPQLLKAVRYLNGFCGFSIRLIKIDAFVEDSWAKGLRDYKFRLDFVDVE